jgi:hypothetical protein
MSWGSLVEPVEINPYGLDKLDQRALLYPLTDFMKALPLSLLTQLYPNGINM